MLLLDVASEVETEVVSALARLGHPILVSTEPGAEVYDLVLTGLDAKNARSFAPIHAEVWVVAATIGASSWRGGPDDVLSVADLRSGPLGARLARVRGRVALNQAATIAQDETRLLYVALRAGFEADVVRGVAAAERHSRTFGVAMVMVPDATTADVDGLSELFRASDVWKRVGATRWSGLLEDVDENGVEQCIERLASATREHLGLQGACFGSALWRPSMTAREVLRRAEEGLLIEVAATDRLTG